MYVSLINVKTQLPADRTNITEQINKRNERGNPHRTKSKDREFPILQREYSEEAKIPRP